MKRLFWSVLLTGTLLIVPNAPAQGFGGGSGMEAAMMKIFGKSTSFSADAELKLDQKAAKNMPSGIVMKMTYADGKVRSDLDLSKLKGVDMPADQIAQMKQMGMDLTTSIVRPDLKKMYLIYPNMKAYVEMDAPNEVANADEQPKIEKQEIGKETVDGHPCIKHKITITEKGSSKKHEMFTWNATDLKDFPVKLETTSDGQKGTVLFKNVKFDKPGAETFDTPKGFKKYANVQQMIMEKMLGPDGAPKL